MRRSVPAGLFVLLLIGVLGFAAERPTNRLSKVVNPEGLTIRIVDAAGELRDVLRPDGTPIGDPAPAEPGGGRIAPEGLAGVPGLRTGIAPAAALPTVDRVTTLGGNLGAGIGIGLVVPGLTDTFFMSDGTSWRGSGTNSWGNVNFNREETSGTTIRYYFDPPYNGTLYEHRDTDYTTHAARGRLTSEGPIVLEATAGSRTGVLRGTARIVMNEPEEAYQLSYFNFYSSIVGAVVPYEVTYTLDSRTFESGIFFSYFNYGMRGFIDFAHPVSLPAVQSVEIRGVPMAAAGYPVRFAAVALYEGGASLDVSSRATWSVSPESAGAITAGLLDPAPLASGQLTARLHVEYEENGVHVAADKDVVIRATSGAETDQGWETYQADSRHTGHVPTALDPDTFTFKWQKSIPTTRPLNAIAAADGKVFLSTQTYFAVGPHLFALDAHDGHTLWTKDFGVIASVNAPAYAYGNVYLQTVNNIGSTFLWAFEATSGAELFRSPFESQYGRYYAPTIGGGAVFMNGGYYGGMYSFDAFTGEQRWFRSLDQYDSWTPALDDIHAYAYLGGALKAVRRDSGNIEYAIPDPHAGFVGYSLNLAPVLGGMDDAVVVASNRLLRFGLLSRSVLWEKTSAFSGQPSVSEGVVYAIDNGGLVAVDETTGADLWTWRPPAGVLAGTLVVTGTHVIASTFAATYAVDLLSRQQVWSYPVGGALALAEETLYIATNGGSTNGILTAIAVPEFTPVPVVSLEITGPDTVVEKSTAHYTALAHYADGRVRERTGPSDWSVIGTPAAAIDGDGLLSVDELLAPSIPVTVGATYTERGATVEGAMTVNLVIGVSLDDFIARNLAYATGEKEQILQLLQRSVEHEEAAKAVLGTERGGGAGAGARPNRVQALNRIVQALHWDSLAGSSLASSLDDLRESQRDMQDAVVPRLVILPTLPPDGEPAP